MQPASKPTKRLTRILVAAFAAGSLVLVGGAPAGAVSYVTYECNATGVANVDPGETSTSWGIQASGVCYGGGGTWTVNVSGSGASDALGLCSESATVTNLAIDTTVSLSTPGRPTVTRSQTWGASQTTFPVTTPFSISEGGSTVGGGNLFTRIFAKCPGAGSPATNIYWTMTV